MLPFNIHNIDPVASESSTLERSQHTQLNVTQILYWDTAFIEYIIYALQFVNDKTDWRSNGIDDR